MKKRLAKENKRKLLTDTMKNKKLNYIGGQVNEMV